MYNAVRYLSTTFVRKLKHIVCKKNIYTVEDADLLQFPLKRSLVRAYVTELQFVFSMLDDEIMANLNIQKTIPPSLEVINVDYASSSRIDRNTTFSDVYQNTSIIFGKESSQRANLGS